MQVFRSMFVVTPQKLVIMHLKQCLVHLESAPDEVTQLLYAASIAHLTFHTVLMMARYSQSDLAILEKRTRKKVEARPNDVHEGIRVDTFSNIFEGFLIDENPDLQIQKTNIENQRQVIEFLKGIRDRVEHPMPGLMGYTPLQIIDAIDTIVSLSIDLLGSSLVLGITKDDSYEKGKKVADRIHNSCARVRSAMDDDVI